MKILFMDDSIRRHDTMHQNCIGLDVDYVYDADSAIDKLNSNEYDLVMLDHDLDEKYNNMILDNSKDGRFVANYIAENLKSKYKNTFFVIHSLNHPASEIMKSTLKLAEIQDVICLPFAWMYIEKSNDTVVFNTDKKFDWTRNI